MYRFILCFSDYDNTASTFTTINSHYTPLGLSHNMIKDEKFANSSYSHFDTMKNMVSWQQQSATAWTELYKEFASNSQKMSEFWSNTLWNTRTSKDREIKDNTKKGSTMRALVLQGEGAFS